VFPWQPSIHPAFDKREQTFEMMYTKHLVEVIKPPWISLPADGNKQMFVFWR